MPYPLKPNENVYIDHKIRDGSYSMPSMQAAPDHYTIAYLVSGDRRWISTETIRTSHGGDASITKPHVYHRNCAMSDVLYDRYVIKVRTEIFQPIINITGTSAFDMLCRNYLHFTKESQSIIRKMCDEMLEEYQKNAPYSQLILQGMVYRLFFYLYENHIPDASDNSTLYLKNFDDRIQKALIYAESNLAYGPSIKETASCVNLSPSHFSHLFKSVTGSSYTDYLTDVRLQHVRILLSISELSVSEIAAKTGFSNSNYLCTLFKKHYGITPTEYRKTV